MSFVYLKSDIENIKFNNTEIEKVNFNNIPVYEKTKYIWKKYNLSYSAIHSGTVEMNTFLVNIQGNLASNYTINNDKTITFSNVSYINQSGASYSLELSKFTRYFSSYSITGSWPNMYLYPSITQNSQELYGIIKFDTNAYHIVKLKIVSSQGSTYYGEVSSINSDTFPSNGEQDGYWYVYDRTE